MRDAKSGSAVRLECNGIQFLRTVCRLTHNGPMQYAKGDGDAFADYLEKNYPHLSSDKIGRAEQAKRQDWSLEASFNIFPLLEPLMAYTVAKLLDESNVLRDSLLVSLECIHFEAYVHVNAVLWRVVFKELRALTNSKGLEISPIELNELYEHLYDVGKMLQTPECMSVFDAGFRPWPRIIKAGQSDKFYTAVDANLEVDLDRLKTYNARADTESYCTILRKVLALFGEGVIASLDYTMDKYLKQTDGELSNDKREDWEIEATKGMMSHNNFAERPFAVLKAFAKTYPALSLRNLAWLSHSLVNGTHRPASTFGKSKDRDGNLNREAGIALTAHPDLKVAVNTVCSVRRKKTGVVTVLVRQGQVEDKEEQNSTRKRKAEEKYQNNLRLKAVKAARTDKAEHTATHNLVVSNLDLENELAARRNSKQSQITFLKDQFNARVNGDVKRTYNTIGSEFRKRGGGLKITAENPKEQMTYLIKVIKLMILEDQDAIGINAWALPCHNYEYLRFLPTISTEFANPKVKAMKAKFEAEVSELATPVDDPVYVALSGKYIGAILYDFETRASWKLYRVNAIQFIRSYSKVRASCWEATCEPVYRNAQNGQFLVPAEEHVPDSKVIKATALQGYALAEYREGVDKDPTYLPWVEQYVAHFRTVILPRYPSLFSLEVLTHNPPTSLCTANS